MSAAEEDRAELERLLPFLANGALEGEERARAEAAVEQDPALAAELAALKRIRSEMQAREPASSPGPLGLARVMRVIEADAAAPASPARASTKTSAFSGVGELWRIAAVVALALLAAQSVMVWSGRGVDPAVELAGGPVAAQSGPALSVAFAPEAPEAEIRALLLDLELEIISGPSSLGLYRLAARDEAGAERALTALGAAPAIVESVERE